MAHGSENDSPESHKAKISEFGRAYIEALLAGDERGAEIAIREAMDAKITTPEIDDDDHRPGAVADRRTVAAG